MPNNRLFLNSQIDTAFHDGNITVNEIVSSKYEKLHNKFYNIALEDMKKAKLQEYLNNDQYKINITENINKEDILGPSTVIVTIYNKKGQDSSSIISRYKIDLTDWWPSTSLFADNYHNSFTKAKSSSKFAEQYDLHNYECIYKDYVEGKCLVRSKITEQIKELPIKSLLEINKNSRVIPDSSALRKIYTSDFFSSNI